MANDERRTPPGWLAGLVRVDDAIAKVEGVVVVASLVTMLLLYFLYVVFRNVSASMGEKWLAELPLQVVLWVSLFGGALAARQGRHIAIDIAPRILGPGALRWVRLATNLAAVAMSAVLAYAGWRYLVTVELAEDTMVTYLEVTFGATTLVQVPTWFFVAAAPVAFALTGWHFAVLALREWLGFPPQIETIEDDFVAAPVDDDGDGGGGSSDKGGGGGEEVTA